MVLEVNERGKQFYITLRDLVEQMYKHSFHLQYKNQFDDSKNQVLCKLKEELPKNWSMRPVKFLIEKTYNNKKKSFKK